MYSVTSNAVARKLKIFSSDVTLLDQTMSHNISLVKSGNIVTMALRIWKEGEITVSAGQVLATLPEGYRPIGFSQAEIIKFDANNTHQLIVIDAYGSIYTVLTQTYSRLDFYITASWITG